MRNNVYSVFRLMVFACMMLVGAGQTTGQTLYTTTHIPTETLAQGGTVRKDPITIKNDKYKLSWYNNNLFGVKNGETTPKPINYWEQGQGGIISISTVGNVIGHLTISAGFHGDYGRKYKITENGVEKNEVTVKENQFEIHIYNFSGTCYINIAHNNIQYREFKFEYYKTDELAQLNVNEGNSPVISSSEDAQVRNVTLTRSLGSGYWNTLCLPFSVSEGELANPDLFNCKDAGGVKVFAISDYENNVVKFTRCSSIEAGKPYLIKPNDDVSTVSLKGRKISTTVQEEDKNGVRFVGFIEPTNISNISNAVYLATDGYLKKQTGSKKMKGMRAYFVLPSSSQAKDYTFVFEEPEDEISLYVPAVAASVEGFEDNRIYNLNGLLMGTDESQLPKGIYVKNGRKFVK